VSTRTPSRAVVSASRGGCRKDCSHWTTGVPGYRVVSESFPTNDGVGGDEETAPAASKFAPAAAAAIEVRRRYIKF